MRAAAVVLGLAAIVGWAGSAHAGHVDVERLADANLPRVPTAPKALGWKEKMEEVRWNPADPNEGRALTLIPSDQQGCMFRGDDPPPLVANPDDPSSQSEGPLWAGLTIDRALPRVGSFRTEAIVGEGEGAKLAVSRGWYDRQTLGLRRIDEAEIPLTVLSQSPMVYAYRDGGMVDIVVPAKNFAGIASRDVDGRLRSFSCPHARVAVPLDAASGTALVTAQFESALAVRRGQPGADHTTLQLSLSVTRTSRDVAPWVSLAVGILR